MAGETVREPTAASAVSGGTGRIHGLDLARFLAIAGMMGTHLWLFDELGETPSLVAALSGKASALFAVLAGVGTMLTGSRSADGGRGARRNLAGRGLALVVIGLTLGQLYPPVLVILAYYGVMFLLAVPLLRLPPARLLGAAVLWALLWPVCSHLLRDGLGLDASPDSPRWSSLGEPVPFALELLLTGAYPALSWMSYLMLGMAIGAALAGPERTRPARPLLFGGAGVAALAALLGVLCARLFGARLLAADLGFRGPEGRRIGVEELAAGAHGVAPSDSPWYLLSTGPHTGTPFDLLITGGTAAAVIGLCLLFGPRSGPRARGALAPVLGAGAAPLTVYSLHVLAAAAAWSGDRLSAWWVSSPQLWALHLAGALAIGLLLRLTGRRGPLEALVSACGRLLARSGGRSQASARPGGA